MKWIAVIASFVLLPMLAWAQPTGERIQERVEARRVAFLTERLSLTPEEAQLFWPIYNEYRDKLKAIRKEGKPDKPVEQMTEAEADAAITEHFDNEQKELDLQREMAVKLHKAIPARKIALLQGAEKEFKLELLKEIRERRQEGGGGGRRPGRG
jgi:hypothetical protein